jgi:hypothetical protein
MKWENLTQLAHAWMKELGEFTPTVDGITVKGYMWDSDMGGGTKVYWNSTDLREIALACMEVACYLESQEKS